MSSSPAEPARRGWRVGDSLFARLLLLQVLLAIGLLVVFGALVYVERNAAVARLVGERWAPALREAAGWAGDTPPVSRSVQRSVTRPPQALRPSLATPRMVALDDELRRHGLTVLDAAVARGPAGPLLWLELRERGGGAAWYGLSDPALLPNLPGRLLMAVLLAAVLLAAVSWIFTRRLTRPLEQLRERMRAHRPGEPVNAVARVENASPEIAAIETAYDELLQRLARHERERALLLAGVSHDLRGPLARIRMAAGLLPESTESERWREAIVRNTQVADRLIESFLDHVRSGELPLDQRADAAELARSAALAAGRAEGELTVLAPASAPLQRSHPLLLERLIANLLDNAFKHGRAPVELQVEPRAGRVVIEVRDAGDGVPEQERERLLQAFARGDAARSTPGTGLGLAIVERVVVRMGGTLGFERRGVQHVVRVELPAT